MQGLRHIAIIMDGNRRWAQEHGKLSTSGHRFGAETLAEICKEAAKMDLEFLTVYAFSTENIKRSDREVSLLLGLITEYMKYCRSVSMENNIRFGSIGDRSGLPEALREEIRLTEEVTSGNTGMCLTVAINYGGRNEMARAFQRMLDDGIRRENVTEELISSYLDTKDIPDPDLVIRTSGECRLSNFMLWQMAYSELYFTDKYWPDFTVRDLKIAIDKFKERSRRFGLSE